MFRRPKRANVCYGTLRRAWRKFLLELRAVTELRDRPAGTIRITATEFAIDTLLVPKLAKLLGDYPDIKVEMIVDYGLTDIVAH